MTTSTSVARPRRRIPRAGDSQSVRRGTRFHRLFLSRYTVATKLLVAAGFLLFPLSLFAAYFVSAQISALREAGAEHSGTLMYHPIDRLVWDVAAHSEAESLVLIAAGGNRNDVLLEKATADLREFEALEHLRGNIETRKILARLEAAFTELKAEPPHTVEESLARHDRVLDAAFDLGELIGSEWGLFRDPDTALSDLSNVTFRELPHVVRNVAELRARLAFDASDPEIREANRMRMVELASIGIDRSNRSRAELVAAVDMPGSSVELQDGVRAELAQWNERILPWLTHLSAQLSAGSERSVIRQEALADSVGMYQSLETVHDHLFAAAEKAVVKRDASQRHRFWAAVVSTFLTLFTGGLLMHAISIRTAGGVRRLLFVSGRIAEGDYNQNIDELGADEISQLFAGFAEMQRRLVLQIGTERSQLVINTRIRAALDNVAGSVIVAAVSGAIVHINRSANVMLTDAEPDIRSRIPEFSAADLHGNPLQPLCETLVGEPLGLMSLDSTLVREFVAGSRTFRIVVNPILAENGERFRGGGRVERPHFRSRRGAGTTRDAQGSDRRRVGPEDRTRRQARLLRDDGSGGE